MDKLTSLVLKYKENNSQIILTEILSILNPIIKKKATYVFFAKWYPLNLYHPCKHCKNCNRLNDIPKSEHNLICKNCDICQCVKGFFNLNKYNLCSYDDVYQDLYLTVLELIKKYTLDKEFSNYFYTTLWEWKPSFITQDFVKFLFNKSLTQEDEEGNETQIDIAEDKQEPKLSMEEIFKFAKTKREKELLNLFLNDKKMTQEKAGKILNISQQAISLIFNKLKKKIKKNLLD